MFPFAVTVSVTVTTEGVDVTADTEVVVDPLAFAAAWKAENLSPGFTLEDRDNQSAFFVLMRSWRVTYAKTIPFWE